MMTINENAPVQVERSVVIRAPIENIWAIHAAMRRWPEWHPEIKWVNMEGPVVPGTLFRWKSGMFTIESRLEEVRRNEVLSWTGRLMGIAAVHTWHFEKRADGTLVTTAESMEGILARLFSKTLTQTTEDTLMQWLKALKEASEKQVIQPESQQSRSESR